ncbi:MAG: hypothetical protein FJW34_08150 [Acidobacteria bacterium]|nr:hypothetical protein [Acidobacteriota bacterium]
MGLAQALVAYLAVLALTPSLVSGVWWVLRWLKPDYHSLAHGDTYNRSYYVAAMVLLVFAVTAGAYRVAGRRRGVAEMMAGPLLVWSGLALVSAALLRGASFLFTWPLAASAAGFAVAALGGGVWWTEPSGDERARPRQALMVTLCALPAVVLLIPTIDMLWVAMGMRFSWACAVVVALLLGPLWGQVAMLGARRRWWPAVSALIIALCLLGTGLATARFSPEHPGHNSVFYALDADSGMARWASADRKVDEWTAQFFPSSSRGPVPGFPRDRLLNGPAPAVKLAAPEVQVVEDRIAGTARWLTLLVRSPRRAVNLQLTVAAEAQLQAVEVNGKKLGGAGAATRARTIAYRGLPPEGVRLSLLVTAGKPVQLTVLDQSYGLPEGLQGSYHPRPAHLIPFGGPYSADATVVARTYRW